MTQQPSYRLSQRPHLAVLLGGALLLGALWRPAAGQEAPAAAPASEAAAAATAARQEIVEEGIRIVTEKGYFDYSQEEGTVYSNERTRITYKGATLEADHIFADLALSEVQAAGNVILAREGAEVRAERMVYNFREGTGSAWKATGAYDTLRIRHAADEGEVPTFRRVAKGENVFSGANATTCEFPVPHYYMRAREIVVYEKERIFMKGVTLYVRGVPVMYLPVYSRSLGAGSPWFFHAGYKSRIGAWARLGYTWEHSTEAPDLADPTGRTVLQSKGDLSLYADYYSKRGPGTGVLYDYYFGQGRHVGQLDLYYLKDSHREVDTQDDLARWRAGIEHRSQLKDEISWIVNVDYFSDPDLYNDVLDLFQDFERRRVMERRARTALTLAREDYVARLLFEVKDRIGRNRISDFSDFVDNDRDFDEQPGLELDERDDEGLDTNRWGRATVRAPQITAATRWLNIWGLPSAYFKSELNVFNNLDKGLVTAHDGDHAEEATVANWDGITPLGPTQKVRVGTRDDAYVRGFDWYNAVLYRLRLGTQTNLSVQLGAGGGMAARDEDDFGFRVPPDPLTGTYPVTLFDVHRDRGLTFVGPETFLVGRERFNAKDIKDGFVYGDAKVRLDHRFSDALTADLSYNYRATTENFIGDWYARIGNRFVRDDLYNFRLRQHNVVAALRYALAQPRLDLALLTMRNLVGAGERFPGEQVSTTALAGAWRTLDETFGVDGSIGISEFQLFAPSDPLAETSSAWHWNGNATYKPRSGLWWTSVGTVFRERLGSSDRVSADDDRVRVSDVESELIYTALLGGKIGPKWTSQVAAEWNSQVSGLRAVKFGFERDLHDAMLLFMVGFKQDVFESDEDDEGSATNLDFRISIQPKLPGAATKPGMTGVRVVRPQVRTPAVSSTTY